ncbi:hypothetical protein [Stratiformator vulcanicus]|uniref:Uncharacterized protein n=1 Tax=Stratiformator vulcanicus TaxID=2527980 RepID=A0A517R1W5_9PLAN|nr:hypothetical protein [Stratiformator vulcanicus]QDT37885.1 hypothetical protein Pan189_22680 [Stratiformator vulcanicus]
MIRAIFFSTGLFISLCGAILLGVDRLVLNPNVFADTAVSSQGRPWYTHMMYQRTDTISGFTETIFEPPDWVSFALLSIGAVVVLYSIAIPRKSK